MQIIADLHFHSKYSRAVSPQMVLPEIGKWAKLKGIDLVTTADFTHPLWFRELRAGLTEVGEGIYSLTNNQINTNKQINKSISNVKFLLTTEIASIFSQGGRLRRIHTLIFAPDFPTAERINDELAKRGVKLFADGRPMTGLSVRELAELVLSVSPDCLVIPAHLWTPWFGTLGDKGGFESIEEAYGDWAKYIYAIETGHSSDPGMNWRVAELDNRAILSFSDGHSPSKMGREATVFEIEDIKKLRYEDIKRAIVGKWEVGSGKCDIEVGTFDNKGGASGKSRDQNISPQSQKSLTSHISPHISYTIEFYPEEGKYHYTGHQKCQVRQSPEETKKLGETCPVCGKHLTVGVMQRVEELADRIAETRTEVDENGVRWINLISPTGRRGRPPYVTIVPLIEILAESLNTSVSGQKAVFEYKKLAEIFGGELGVLLAAKTEEIARISGEKAAEGIKKVREGTIVIEPGYDGVFGTVKIWPSFAKASEGKKQMSLF